MQIHKLLLPAAVGCVLLTYCNDSKPAAAQKDIFADMTDSTANPANDFFQFVNGGWLKNHPIPASETGWGIGDLVQEEIYSKLQKISDDAAKANAAEGTDTRKIGDFWKTGMDSAKADQLGISPMKPALEVIDGVKTSADVVTAMTKLEPLQTGMFYGGFYIAQDARNSEKMALTLYQGGLGLPDRDYYFNDDEEAKMLRSEYVKHVANMLKLINGGKGPAGAADPEMTMATNIMTFETGLARRSRKLEDLRDPYANYNKFAAAEASKKYTS